MVDTRPQWPHTVDDIVNALDKVWGLVAATNSAGHLIRLEKSLKEPFTYTLAEYTSADESQMSAERIFSAAEKDAAVKAFARLLGFTNV